jgi:hypothetical protein
MTKWSFEVPTAHLDDFEDLQDFIFALSFLIDTDNKYRGWLREQSVKGLKTIWLDNSFNELARADQAKSLAFIARDIGAHRVVSPDDPSWDIVRIADAWEKTANWIPEDFLVVVVKSLEMYNYMQSIGAQHFAISYHIRRDWTLEDTLWVPQNIHFLGLCNTNEIKACQPISCDTSRPIKLAIENRTLDDWMEEGFNNQYHPPGQGKLPYFNMKMTTKQIDLARHNIIKLKEVCK